jgi:hypothetical protein
MPWEPLLDGSLAAQVLAAVHDIAVAAAATPVAAAADRAVFWAYAAPILYLEPATAAGDAALDAVVASLESGAPRASLHDGGIAGLGWALTHVVDGDDDLEVLDCALVALLHDRPWTGGHDLVHGVAGIGVYFLERLATGGGTAARDGVELVVEQLARSATPSDDGVAWLTSPRIAPPSYREQWPAGYYDCGIAHGTPGVLAWLGRAAALDDPPPAAQALHEAASRWLAAQRATPDPRGRFPAMFGPGEPADRARTAWCYGDPGIAAALWGAAPRFGPPPALAVETALDVAGRRPELCGVRDSALCHGTAGIAHLCNRFYQASGDARFGDAARAWYARTLALRGPASEAFGSFAQWRDGGSWRPAPGLLDGALGVGLALAAAITDTEPAWDRLLLCDLPVRMPGACS